MFNFSRASLLLMTALVFGNTSAFGGTFREDYKCSEFFSVHWYMGKHFFRMNDDDGSINILRAGANKRQEGDTDVYESKFLDLDQKISKKELVKHEEFIDSYMMAKEKVIVHYFKDAAGKNTTKVSSVEYSYKAPGSEISKVKFDFKEKGSNPENGCLVEKTDSSAFYIDNSNIPFKVPRGNYDVLKCAKFDEYLYTQKDLVACMNMAEKMLGLKKELLSAKSAKAMDAKEEKKFIKEYRNDIFDAHKVIGEAIEFNQGCKQLYTDRGMKNALSEYKASLQQSEEKEGSTHSVSK